MNVQVSLQEGQVSGVPFSTSSWNRYPQLLHFHQIFFSMVSSSRSVIPALEFIGFGCLGIPAPRLRGDKLCRDDGQEAFSDTL